MGTSCLFKAVCRQMHRSVGCHVQIRCQKHAATGWISSWVGCRVVAWCKKHAATCWVHRRVGCCVITRCQKHAATGWISSWVGCCSMMQETCCNLLSGLLCYSMMPETWCNWLKSAAACWVCRWVGCCVIAWCQKHQWLFTTWVDCTSIRMCFDYRFCVYY